MVGAGSYMRKLAQTTCLLPFCLRSRRVDKPHDTLHRQITSIRALVPIADIKLGRQSLTANTW